MIADCVNFHSNCRTNGALGAGLLSSIAELRHALSDDAKPKIKPFDPEVTAREECIITSFQNAYYYSESFEEAKDRMRYCMTVTIFFLNLFAIYLMEYLGNSRLPSNDLSVFVIIRTRKVWRCLARRRKLPDSCPNCVVICASFTMYGLSSFDLFHFICCSKDRIHFLVELFRLYKRFTNKTIQSTSINWLAC